MSEKFSSGTINSKQTNKQTNKQKSKDKAKIDIQVNVHCQFPSTPYSFIRQIASTNITYKTPPNPNDKKNNEKNNRIYLTIKILSYLPIKQTNKIDEARH